LDAEAENESFADRLTLAMKVLNLSRAQIASQVGVDKSLVGRWMAGQVTPTAYNRARISEALAKLKPGFNLTHWDIPRAEFEEFLGLEAESPEAARTAPTPTAEALGGSSAKRPLWLAGIAVVVLAVLAIGAWLLTARRPPPPVSPPKQVAADTTIPSASIAVLPFTNMSGDPSKAYFSDGVTEELLNDLANVPDLMVAARTSSFAFRNKNQDIREIARVLRVRTILEGSVREQGDKIRITAQLIDASSGYHILSQTYDRNLGDILTTQAEIARDITATLTNRLLKLPEPLIIPPDVYRQFLRARSLTNTRTEDNIKQGIKLLRDVVTRQPDFVQAQALLAASYVDEYDRISIFYGGGVLSLYPDARATLDATLHLDPDNLVALIADTRLAITREEWSRAANLLAKVKALNPNNAAVLKLEGIYYFQMGFFDRAITAIKSAARLDPLSIEAWANLGEQYLYAANFEAARAAALRAIALNPTNPGVLNLLCIADVGSKRIKEALAVEAHLRATSDGKWIVACYYSVDIFFHRIAEARALADRSRGDFGVGVNRLYLGDDEVAMDHLEKAFREKTETQIFALPYYKVYPHRLFETNARWKALTRDPRYRAWQDAHDRIAASLSGATAN